MGDITETHLVPVCAATSFFKSPTVSCGLHLILTFLPNLSLTIISIMLLSKILIVNTTFLRHQNFLERKKILEANLLSCKM